MVQDPGEDEVPAADPAPEPTPEGDVPPEESGDDVPEGDIL